DAIETRTDPRGVVTTFGYDALNRLNSISYNTVSGVRTSAPLSFTYKLSSPGKGAVETITDSAGTESFSYDSLGRLSTRSRTITGNSNTYTTSYEYNPAGQLSALVYPSGKRVRYNYDDRGRPTGMDKMSGSTVLLSYLSAIGYNQAGQVTGLSLGSNLSESYDYDSARLQLTRQRAIRSGTTLLDLNYSYQSAAGVGTTSGNSGQLMAITAASTVNGEMREESYSYDTLGRLVTRVGWGGGQRRFDYDRWGSRSGVWNTHQSGFGQQIQTASIKETTPGSGIPTNQLSSITNRNGNTSATLAHSYDLSGNLTNDGQHSYKYDSEGRIAVVDEGSGQVASYSYDLANRRVKRVVAGVATYYIWDGGQVIAEYSDSPAPQVNGGGLRYYVADRLSTRMVLDSSGIVKGTQEHRAFGEEAFSSGELEKHRFTNYDRDSESGTDYAVNRQYSQGSGRFLQPDIFTGDTFDPQTLNRYSYGYNDPVNMYDPDGQIAFAVAGVILVGGGLLGGVLGA
ncbi:MAG: RHS repeat-associated core domain-containing protein, partial [Pyrinomonadaceae bacterium]